MRKSLIFVTLLFAPATGVAQDEAASIELDNPGFEQAEPGSALTGWGGNMLPADGDVAGYKAVIDTADPAAGSASVRIESQGVIDAGKFGTITRALDVTALRGRKIRLTGMARVDSPAPKHAGFWLRVDRPGGQSGFFDNMGDRPITSGAWQSYSIEGDVAADANQIVFGFLVQGQGKAWVDDFAVEDIGPMDLPHFEGVGTPVGPTRDGSVEGDVAAAPVTDRGVTNLQALARVYGLVRWFHPSDQAAEADWGRFLIGAIPRVEGAETSTELATTLAELFQPVAPAVRINEIGDAFTVPLYASTRHLQWTYHGFPSPLSRAYSSERMEVPAAKTPSEIAENITEKIAIFLPLSVPIDDSGSTIPKRDTPAVESGKPEGWLPAGHDRTTRIAGIVSAWAMFDHFYPYWDVVDTDWDAIFAPMLQDAALASDDIAYRDVLLRLVEGLHDGHGGVNYRDEGRALLPLDWEWIENELVITAPPAGAPDASGYRPGMVVKAIDGVPVQDAIAAKKARISGSDQWKTELALSRLRYSHEVGQRLLLIEDADGAQSEITLPLSPMSRDERVREPKPDVVSELEPGIVYVDIDRLTDTRFSDGKAQIESAKGLVFDLRGYPKGRYAYLSHMTDSPIRSAEMNIPSQTLPHAQFDSWQEGGWRITPALPRYTDKVVFITDGGAISWSESILGTVKANGLGTIIGVPTAGANGNVTTFRIPGGYQLRWTGMQVKNRDGTQHHILGVQPDIRVERTLAGVRERRDELLDAALAEVKRQMAED
ncbi:S41 family peptidase [Pontixanthobacter aestiaquae]|uniref:Tail specific protease domain-containing protein n=1 Tax=Pontixanthobacter aestiaquae TaxID=1509367 RepID=A0A844Z1N2_9SPHN|nr:S41 family peptidase [Pontixanthobacter aestiaquae]MDN3647180.1 S41 family peptidase [Pontixanthobacter aestiaquae]MXO81845.1 hypothetical protein [Pontixanthobacter aestiaquae]